MDAFAKRAIEDKEPFFELAASRTGFSKDIIEKDFWVCWTLKHLFSIPEIGGHLIFKGGTSLSKAYKIIERFSEDIDISVSKHYLGFKDDLDPACATSTNKQRQLIKELSLACQEFVQNKLRDSLSESFSKILDSVKEPWKIEPDETDPDKQTLLFYYPTFNLDQRKKYIKRMVKIELGARGGLEPKNECPIASYAAEASPQIFEESAAMITTLAPERTFWEKATILHMYSNYPENKSIPERQSRHFFDFYRLLQSYVKENAVNMPELLRQVSEHKKIYFRAGWAKYEEAVQGSLRLVPNATALKALENDYNMMKEMFYGEVVQWDAIIEEIRSFEEEFNL